MGMGIEEDLRGHVEEEAVCFAVPEALAPRVGLARGAACGPCVLRPGRVEVVRCDGSSVAYETAGCGGLRAALVI